LFQREGSRKAKSDRQLKSFAKPKTKGAYFELQRSMSRRGSLGRERGGEKKIKPAGVSVRPRLKIKKGKKRSCGRGGLLREEHQSLT